MAERAESPTGANKFPHFVSFDSPPATPDRSPSRDQGLFGVELGPELGFFQAPRVNTESKKPTVAVQPVSQHLKRICAINLTKLSDQTNEVAGEGHTTERPLGLEFGLGSWDHAEAQGNARGEIFSRGSPSLIGSNITAEKEGQGGSTAKTLAYPWERIDRSPTPFPSPEPGIAPQGSNCSSLLRFWESQLSRSSPSVSLPEGGTRACISPMRGLEGRSQFHAEEGTKNTSPIPEGEEGEGNPISSVSRKALIIYVF